MFLCAQREAYIVLNHTVHPKYLSVPNVSWSISPILLKVGIPNSECGCNFGLQIVTILGSL